MSSNIPQWASDIASISSIIGLIVTIFLLFEARKIRMSFLRRARLPTITKELSKTISEISTRLKVWSKDKNAAVEQFARAKGLLENVKTKLPPEERRQIYELLAKLQPRKWLFLKSNLSDITEDHAWDLYADLNTVVATLEQLVKDSRWD